MEKPVLVWFKSDLRLQDNAMLTEAARKNQSIVAVYVFDERLLQKNRLGFTRLGAFRARYILQSLEELGKKLSAFSVPLIIRSGIPETEISALAIEVGATDVFTAAEAAFYEQRMLKDIASKLNEENISLHTSWNSTLLHPDDLPMSIRDIPPMFTTFRKQVEQHWKVRATEPIAALKGYPLPSTSGFSIAQLGLGEPCSDNRSVIRYTGGELAAWQRLEQYFWINDQLHLYKETRDQLMGEDYSSKLSVALATGTLSPRQVYWEVKRYEQERITNESTYWLVFELLWRDYFFMVALQHGKKIFLHAGIQNKLKTIKNDWSLFERWRLGQTGQPFVDANMKELLYTGFMSNRGRQNVASYLVHDLRLNWTWGAQWFEHQLLDYDPCSNWLNWAYVAGVGNDPRPNRYFNPESQKARYDPEGKYVRLWNG